MMTSVVAVRIFLSDNATPMADILMNDGVIEHIQWTNQKQRKQFESMMNVYTLFYDERPKASWARLTNQ